MSEIVESKELLLIKFRDRELRGCTFRRMRLSTMQLIGADFTDCTFDSCDMDGMTLTGANFTRATFNRVDLRRVRADRGLFKRTQFNDCNLTELDAQHALFEDTQFERCDMDNAIFDHAYLGGCTFHPNRAYGLKLRQAVLIRCRFAVERGATELTRAQLGSAVVIDCDFPGACLLRADFQQALLVKNNFQAALLRDAQTDRAGLVACNLQSADLPPGWASAKG